MMALNRALAAALFLMAAIPASAQVLATADTLGKGKSGVLFSDNVIVPGDGIAHLNIAYVEFARGLSDRFDLYLSGGETTTEGATQGWAGGGGNLRLVRIRKAAVSLFAVASVPLNRRDEACQVLLNPAVVVSGPITPRLSLYSGLNTLVPLGARARGIFTPPSAKVNVPIGATYALGSWGVWGEVDVGTLDAIGVGVTRVF
jgi:hypothetical protein